MLVEVIYIGIVRVSEFEFEPKFAIFICIHYKV